MVSAPSKDAKDAEPVAKPVAKPEGDATGAARVNTEAAAEAVKVATAKEAKEAKAAKEAQRQKDFGEHIKDGVENVKAAQEKRELQRRQDSEAADREVPTRPDPAPRAHAPPPATD